MFDIQLLAAKDWWGAIVPIVFFIIYLLNQFLTVTGKANKQAKPRTPPKRPLVGDQPPRRPAPPAPGGKQDQLSAEIEEFLKRANQRRGEKPRQEASPTAKAPPKQSRTQQQRPSQSGRTSLPPLVPREEPVDVRPVEDRELSSVSKSVEQHLGHRGFSERAEHLADDIVRADTQMEQHLQETFGRRLGTLASSDATSRTPLSDTEPMAVGLSVSDGPSIALMLADPKQVRNAMILSEILTRPEHRW